MYIIVVHVFCVCNISITYVHFLSYVDTCTRVVGSTRHVNRREVVYGFARGIFSNSPWDAHVQVTHVSRTTLPSLSSTTHRPQTHTHTDSQSIHSPRIYDTICHCRRRRFGHAQWSHRVCTRAGVQCYRLLHAFYAYAARTYTYIRVLYV